jgi:hypothetical protein
LSSQITATHAAITVTDNLTSPPRQFMKPPLSNDSLRTLEARSRIKGDAGHGTVHGSPGSFACLALYSSIAALISA